MSIWLAALLKIYRHDVQVDAIIFGYKQHKTLTASVAAATAAMCDAMPLPYNHSSS